MNLWCRLKHPNIVPFDKMVVDEIEGRFVGFTSKYIPGGTLEENPTRTFKLKWLHQLTDVVDDLNLRLGVVHQDVAARNILIDEVTDTLMLFDFNFSARINGPGYFEPRNDVKGVVFTLYEVITRDKARQEKRHEDQDVSTVDALVWKQHPTVRLDHPVSAFRKVLDAWRERRRTREADAVSSAAFLDWPPLPDPPPTHITVDLNDGNGPVVHTYDKIYDAKRREMRKEGKTIINWERPPQKWPEKQPEHSS